MKNVVLVDPRTVTISRADVMRYALMPPADESTLPVEDCLEKVLLSARPKAVWRAYPLTREEGMLHLGFAQTGSKSLSAHLKGCHATLLVACTAGFETDIAIARAAALSPLHALMTHAAGTALVEAVADRVCLDLKEEFPFDTLTTRFSPGYGDLPLTMQQDIFRALEMEKTLGITLNQSCLMTPSKSVTAIIGLKSKGEKHDTDQ